MRPSLLLLLAFVASCDIINPGAIDYRQRARDEVDRREGLWRALAIHSYDFDYQRDCTPCSRKKRLASRMLSVALPGLISAMILL